MNLGSFTLNNSIIISLSGNPNIVQITNSCLLNGTAYNTSNSNVPGYFLYGSSSFFSLFINNFTAANNMAGHIFNKLII